MNAAAQLPIPGALWGRYPERRARRPLPLRLLPRRYGARADALGRIDLRSLSDAALAAHVRELRQRLAREGLAGRAVAQALAAAGELAWRELGQRPHRVQLIAALAMLDGCLAEMATGEGKTLAAALAAAVAALARVPVHVITANDYLAQRDAAALRGLYARLGLSTGAVAQDMDASARRAAYACDIAYCSAKELVFDYLRDSLAQGAAAPRRVLRGLCMAIVDEADSILIDEASVPFILSRARHDASSRDCQRRALELAAALEPGRDFTLDLAQRSAELTAAGQQRAEALDGDALWQVRRYREEMVRLAVSALHLLQRDRDYLVRDGRVEIIDPTTGRTAPGRAWSRGLHQMIEIKEGCAASPITESAAQITYQRFFARYLRLTGMSGTLAEGRAELARVYGLRVARVPLRTPSRLAVLPARVFASAGARWRYVAARAGALAASGRAVLIGTDSVADSQTLSELLRARGVGHAVLNARHLHAEAEVVGGAGRPGRITVATSMAGRGTDIALDGAVAERGGLHVMLCQANPSRRVDLQFLGRCARRGEPGSCEVLHCVESEPLRAWLPAAHARWMRRGEELRPRPLAALLVRLALWRARRRQDDQRHALWKQDAELEEQVLPGTPSP
jgi:preprotein translocase subunit SecA